MKAFRRSVGCGLGSVAVLLLLCGCASVSVKEDRWAPGRLEAPRAVLVADYEMPDSALRVDREGAELAAFKSELSSAFSDMLIERLSERVAPARRLGAATPVKGDWVLEGEFTRVNQGSRLLRSLIGWGAGGTKIETRTRVYLQTDRHRRRLLGEIATTGGSNAEPGALGLPVPVTAGVRLVLSASLTGLSPDMRRTTRMISAAVAGHLRSGGHQLPGQSEPVKRPGEFTLP